MKLKTLKDFEDGWKDYDKLFIKKLKQEAIKWIKELQRIEKRSCGYYCPRCEVGWSDNQQNYCWDCGLKISWIKHFFNITSEDLK